MKEPGRIFIEAGPGNGLSQLTRQHGPAVSLATLTEDGEHRAALTALGRVWLAGADIKWPALHHGAKRQRVSLPGYPFERHRYWIEPQPAAKTPNSPAAHPSHRTSTATLLSFEYAASAEDLILQQLAGDVTAILETLRDSATMLTPQP